MRSAKEVKACARCGKPCRVGRRETLCKGCQQADATLDATDERRRALLEMMDQVSRLAGDGGWTARLRSLQGGLASLHGCRCKIRQERWDHWHSEFLAAILPLQGVGQRQPCSALPKRSSGDGAAAGSRLDLLFQEIESMADGG